MVIIGTRQDLHARLIVESLKSSKWVYCERPMAETEEQIEEVLATESASPGRLGIGLNRRANVADSDAK